MKSLFKEEKLFFKNTSIVFGGKLFIAAIALLITPVLTRLYGPESYGTFALYNSIVQILVILGTLALPSALLTAKKEKLLSILKLIFFNIVIFTIVSAISIYFINLYVINQETEFQFFNDYWYLVPIGFLFTSSALTLSSIQLRLKKFSLTTKTSVIETVTAKASNLLNGFLKMGGLGLVLSDLLAKLVSIIILLVKFPKPLRYHNTFNFDELKTTFKHLRDYPLFVMPAQWVSLLSTQLILWFIAYKFSAYELGKYTVALSLLNIPLHILSNSFQPVITQRFVDARDSTNNALSMKKLLILLGVISFLVFGGLFFIPSDWFVYLLGDQWDGIGPIIKILCVWSLVLFIDQSINNGFLVFEKQQQKLYFNLVDLGLQVLVLVNGLLFPIGLQQFILFFVLTKVVASILRIGYITNSALKIQLANE